MDSLFLTQTGRPAIEMQMRPVKGQPQESLVVVIQAGRSVEIGRVYPSPSEIGCWRAKGMNSWSPNTGPWNSAETAALVLVAQYRF